MEDLLASVLYINMKAGNDFIVGESVIYVVRSGDVRPAFSK